MEISIITLFPHFFDSIFSYSIIARAVKRGKIKINTVDIRTFGVGPHRQVDDKPYGGGTGMVLRVDVIDRAIESVRTNKSRETVILLDPKGQVYDQQNAEKLSKFEHLILVCGHYEGFDERIRKLVDFEISIGDFILSGGEIAAGVIVESVARLTPGVLIKEDAARNESFSETPQGRILEHPHYTRPDIYKNEKVPKVLLSGDFNKIEKYRKEEAARLTIKRRPDLKKS
ncbi:MAG: tRNA (guanosine(37)-N1)-methyltransferase TrmD [Candidatus Levybacteria bacterium RIFCSPHIGHO2_01_FULL_40_10]|nr:MAG: tRNA (guanosine(37)-N1)-methyltransferase TrmD [Candidatus Levybacteria bacterium RIFCSPHIGHO2_01_FULL_40_10]